MPISNKRISDVANPNLAFVFKDFEVWGHECKLETLGFSHSIKWLDGGIMRSICFKNLIVAYVRKPQFPMKTRLSLKQVRRQFEAVTLELQLYFIYIRQIV